MKLIVQIPCLNEVATLGETIRAIPRAIAGVDSVELLVIDDGSSDGTGDRARELGVDYIVRHTHNRGLARAFRTGLDACLKLGADIIVNTDADNQYDARAIPQLIAPILEGAADIVIGDRQTHGVAHFSAGKRGLQALGSAVVRRLSGVDVPDAVSGFRALSRDAALQMNIVSPFSYTIEMLIQAGSKNLAVTSIPVATNSPTRPSRLFRNVAHFIARSGVTMVRMYTMYRPLTTFSYIGVALLLIGTIPIARFLVFWVQGDSSGHVQSLVLGGAFLTIGFVTLLIGLLADLVNFNRQLIELTLEKVRRLEYRANTDLGGSPNGPHPQNASVATREAQHRDTPAQRS
jgi:glycosyltransferase involved in cell wall biosynthesis